MSKTKCLRLLIYTRPALLVLFFKCTQLTLSFTLYSNNSTLGREKTNRKLWLVTLLTTFGLKEVWNGLWNDCSTPFSKAYFIFWLEEMETFEIIHWKKGEDILLLLFADIVASLCVAYKHLFSSLPNLFYVEGTVHVLHIY